MHTWSLLNSHDAIHTKSFAKASVGCWNSRTCTAHLIQSGARISWFDPKKQSMMTQELFWRNKLVLELAGADAVRYSV